MSTLVESIVDFSAIQQASRDALQLSNDVINQVLQVVADAAVAQTDYILAENQKDLDRMEPVNPKYDRLQLTAKRLEAIAQDMRNVAGLPSPLGKVLEERTLDNGLQLSKRSVPLGVVGVIYEARPNVTFDVFALCLKAGNVAVLKGGSDAEYSNLAIAEVIRKVLQEYQLNPDLMSLLPASREATHELLNAVDAVDVIIPRGSQNLINYVRENAKVPVIETGAGIVHTYFDQSGDLEKGKSIIFNAKTRRVSVCNALDCLIIHQERLPDLPEIVQKLVSKDVKVYADKLSYTVLAGQYPDELLQPAFPEHFGTEFLAHRMAIKTVANLEEALDHIAYHSSKHSEAIIAEDDAAVQQFMQLVDAAAVYANTSTAYTDGAEFGMGAE
ncbi:MAG: glutamate-5-semialdehyde dehydrogenase, partial [Bacteroidota bacterium]